MILYIYNIIHTYNKVYILCVLYLLLLRVLSVCAQNVEFDIGDINILLM